MSALARSSTAIAAATLAITGLTVPPPTVAPPLQSRDIQLAAVTTPPGGLITSFLGNQVLYCSLIWTSASQGVATVTAASVTGPAEAAATNGLPEVVTAIETARDDTFTALNLPIVPNPTPTVMPHGVLQVAVIGAINVGAAVIFPAFNDVLLGAFQVPDAVARTLAQTGDPVRAVAVGVASAVTVAHDAG